MQTAESAVTRSRNVRRAIQLEQFTLGYMAFEAAAALAIGFATRSASLETFGLDSLIEIASAAVLLWRLNAEEKGEAAEGVERTERRASRLVGISLLALAGYVVVQAGYTLVTRTEPEASGWGISLAVLSLVAMPVLAQLKLQAADRIGSRALHADAFETIACAYLSLALLVGLVANYFLGWWWADPGAALVMLYFIVREAREALAGDADSA